MNLKKLKKVDLRKPKYILPLVILLPLLGLIYYLMAFFTGKGNTTAEGVVTDSINMSLPDAQGAQMEGKMAAMNKRFSEGRPLLLSQPLATRWKRKIPRQVVITQMNGVRLKLRTRPVSVSARHRKS